MQGLIIHVNYVLTWTSHRASHYSGSSFVHTGSHWHTRFRIFSIWFSAAWSVLPEERDLIFNFPFLFINKSETVVSNFPKAIFSIITPSKIVKMLRNFARLINASQAADFDLFVWLYPRKNKIVRVWFLSNNWLADACRSALDCSRSWQGTLQIWRLNQLWLP